MSNFIKVGTGLSCGCCGEYFSTWEGYEDQDQDIGYGICKGCQDDLQAKYEVRMDEMCMLVENNLKAGNQKMYRKASTQKRREIALRMVEKGVIKFRIGKAG